MIHLCALMVRCFAKLLLSLAGDILRCCYNETKHPNWGGGMMSSINVEENGYRSAFVKLELMSRWKPALMVGVTCYYSRPTDSKGKTSIDYDVCGEILLSVR